LKGISTLRRRKSDRCAKERQVRLKKVEDDGEAKMGLQMYDDHKHAAAAAQDRQHHM
jgi:hypothetical protein